MFHSSFLLPRPLHLSTERHTVGKQSLTVSLHVGILAILFFVFAAAAAAQTPGYIYTYAGNGNQGYVNGTTGSSELFAPSYLGSDNSGNLYVVDQDPVTVSITGPITTPVIRKITSAGIVSTIAGGVLDPCCNAPNDNGIPATSTRLGVVTGIAVDSAGNVYLAEDISIPGGSDDIRVRMINPQGIISTFVTLSGVNQILSLVFDSAGNLYMGTDRSILKTTPQGVVSTIAGNGVTQTCAINGIATNVSVYNVQGLAFDSSGNLYFSQSVCASVFKLNFSNGTTSVVANFNEDFGVGFGGDGGPATSAELNDPTQIAIDSNNNIYIDDLLNSRIRVINPAGIINTAAGTGLGGYNGDNILATTANISTFGLALDPRGDVYISDQASFRIREVIAQP